MSTADRSVKRQKRNAGDTAEWEHPENHPVNPLTTPFGKEPEAATKFSSPTSEDIEAPDDRRNSATIGWKKVSGEELATFSDLSEDPLQDIFLHVAAWQQHRLRR